MSDSLDGGRFPLAAEYLAQLPRGLESHPECMVRYSAVVPTIRDHGDLPDSYDLPNPVRALFKMAKADWISEVHHNTLMLVLRQARYPDRDAWRERVLAASHELYSSPLYRILMKVFSPALVVMGAAKRFHTFHRGGKLETTPITKEGGQFVVTSKLKFPEGLWNEETLFFLGLTFCAALEASGAKSVTHEIHDLTSTQASIALQWGAG